MAPEGKAAAINTDAAAAGKKRKRFLPHNKPVKKKGSYPLRPGVQGFFITCDGGREHQASREALNILESEEDEEKGDKKHRTDDVSNDDNASHDNGAGEKPDAPKGDDDVHAEAVVDKANNNKGDVDSKTDELPAMKQCCKTDVPACDSNDKVEHKSIDRLIEAELEELGDKNKRRFVKLDSGCNGVVFVQMRKKDGDKGPKDIVQKIVTTAASTRKHMSRFILRILPIEVSCYASKEEISKAIKPLVEQYFPVETQNPHKFAVLYEARANSGIDRMEIINAVAQSVPKPHKVDLNNPDKTIVVEIARTVCLMGVIEKYKEFSKCNLRQLTSRKA